MKDKTAQYPYIELQKAIDEQKVVVIDNIPVPPTIGNTYIANNLLIIVCHRGAIINDDIPEYRLRAHDVNVLMPDQIVLPSRVTDDLCYTNLAISREFYEQQLLLQYPYTRHGDLFRRRPPCLLTEEQFDGVVNAVNLIRTIAQSKSPHRLDQLVQLLNILFSMLGEYHVANYPDESPGKSNVFSRFYDALNQHYRESHEMAYYANLCCLSPKHFAEVIKRETNIGAYTWISTYITTRAKIMLDSRPDCTVQQISDYLGFCEQSAFARFFKKQTGMTPTAYRDRERT